MYTRSSIDAVEHSIIACVTICGRELCGFGAFCRAKESRATNEGRMRYRGLHGEVVFRFSGATGGVGH